MTNVNEMMVVANGNSNVVVEVSVCAAVKKAVKHTISKPTELVSDLSEAIMHGSADKLNDEHRHMLEEPEILDIESRISHYEELVEMGEQKLMSIKEKGLKAAKAVEQWSWRKEKGFINPMANYDDSYDYFVHDANSLRAEYKEARKGVLYNKSVLDLAKEQHLRMFLNSEEEEAVVRLPKTNTLHWSMVEHFGESFLIKLRSGIYGLDDKSIWTTLGMVQKKRDRKEMTFKHFVEAMGMLYKQAYGITSDIYYAQRTDAMRTLWKEKIATPKAVEEDKDVCICTEKCWYDTKGNVTLDANKVAFGWTEINFVPRSVKWDAIQGVSYDSFIGKKYESSLNHDLEEELNEYFTA